MQFDWSYARFEPLHELDLAAIPKCKFADQPEWPGCDLRSFSLCFLRLLLFDVFTKAFGTEANEGNGEEDQQRKYAVQNRSIAF